MAEPLNCPYCNAQFLPEQATMTPRGPGCPRCLEPLALETSFTTSPGSPEASSPATQPLPSNKFLGLIVLAVMIAFGLLGLGYALWTTPDRRANDFKIPKLPPRELRTPTELLGLGYLSAHCNLIAGMQFIEIEDDPQARKLLAKPYPFYLDLALVHLEAWTGAKLEELDHIVIGANTELRSPALTVVVAGRKHFNAADLAKLHGDKIGDLHGRPVFAFDPLESVKAIGPVSQATGIEGRAWCPDPQILVLAFRLNRSRGDNPKTPPLLIDDLPFPPRAADDGLPAEIRDVLTQRIDRHSLAWVAGNDMVSPIMLGLLQRKLTQESTDFLGQVKTFGMTLQSEQGPDDRFRVSGQLSGPDQAVTRSLVEFLRQRQINEPGLIIAEPPGDAHGPEACWIGVQQSFSLQELRDYLGRFMGNANH